MDWYPHRYATVQGNSGGLFVDGYIARGVLHTTESTTVSSAISSYNKNNSWAHFTIGPEGRAFQHLGINVAARALKNLSGGVETNRAHAIQIEIVGFAAKPLEHTKEQWDALRDLMRWIEQNAGVKPKGPGRAFATKYGQTELRFTNDEWKSFDGWAGHCHVPENLHWDPGAIDLQSLLTSPSIVVGNPVEVDNVQLIPVQINVYIDANGKGWARLPYQIDKIVGVKAHSGTRPGVDGFYDSAPDVVGLTPDDDVSGVGTIVVVQGGTPGGTAPVWFHVIQ